MDNYYTNTPDQNGNFMTPEDTVRLKKKERLGIFLIGLVAGACVIGYILLEDILSLPIALIPKLRELYYSSSIFMYLVTMFLSAFCLLVPFLTGGAYLRKITKVKYRFFEKPKDMVLSVYAVPMGLFACIVGNYLTNIFVSLMGNIGFTLTSPDYSTPSSISGRILYVMAIAVVPPIVEEIALRGCIMQPLRKYGDRFAIIMTAILFAVLHGNLVQAPFAFVAGLAFGYITCMTGSLIPSMCVHFLNNLFSVSIDLLDQDFGDTSFVSTYYIVMEMLFTMIGVIATVFFIFRLNHRTSRNPQTMLTAGGKVSAFVINPTMIIAIMIMIYITSKYVSYSPVK